MLIPAVSNSLTRSEDTVDANDYMFGCQFQPLTAATIRAASVTCASFAADPAGLGSNMTFWFEAQ